MKRITIGTAACAETLALLVAIAWSDGRLDDAEKDGVRAAASKLNLAREVRALVDLALEKPKPASELKFARATDREKAFGFVAGAWMARVDGKLDPKEAELLKTVGDAMGFSEARRIELSSLAEHLSPVPAPGKGKWSEHIEDLFKAVLVQLDAGAGASEADPSDVDLVVE